MILAKLGRFLEIVALISAIFGLSACESKFSWIKAQYSLASHSRYAKPVETGPTFYVAPFGDDANDGSDSAPFATLERARQVVRGINASMDSDITLFLSRSRLTRVIRGTTDIESSTPLIRVRPRFSVVVDVLAVGFLPAMVFIKLRRKGSIFASFT